MPPTLFAGRLGAEYDSAWWQAVHALYEECFPGLPAGIERAAALRAAWPALSTPFVLMERGRALAHVGVIAHPMHLARRSVTVAGIHAVCTTTDKRRQGLARCALARALEWIDERFDIVKLHTDLPAVYESHEFRVVPTHRFRTPSPISTMTNKRTNKRPLHPTRSQQDAHRLARMLRGRTPVSDICAGIDPGWMNTIVASLSGVADSAFWLLEDHDAIVAFGRERGATLVLDVIADNLPPADIIAGAAPDPSLPVEWTFRPDRFGIDAQPTPTPATAGSFMVRGHWPLEEPFGISPLWEH